MLWFIMLLWMLVVRVLACAGRPVERGGRVVRSFGGVCSPPVVVGVGKGPAIRP